MKSEMRGESSLIKFTNRGFPSMFQFSNFFEWISQRPKKFRSAICLGRSFIKYPIYGQHWIKRSKSRRKFLSTNNTHQIDVYLFFFHYLFIIFSNSSVMFNKNLFFSVWKISPLCFFCFFWKIVSLFSEYLFEVWFNLSFFLRYYHKKLSFQLCLIENMEKKKSRKFVSKGWWDRLCEKYYYQTVGWSTFLSWMDAEWIFYYVDLELIK